MFSEIVKSIVKDNAVILEAGAATGEDTVKLCRLYPQGRIYAFEPHPAWHNQAKINLAPYTNVSYYPTALGIKTGEIDFYLSRNDCTGADTTFRPNQDDIFWKCVPPKDFSQAIKVPVWNLDDWAAQHQVEKIDFMRFDMEGAEGAVLQSCPKILQTVTAIQLEYRNTAAFQGSMIFPEVVVFLHQAGFNLMRAQDHSGVHSAILGDALFIRMKKS